MSSHSEINNTKLRTMGTFLVPIAPAVVSVGIYLFLSFYYFGFSSTMEYDHWIESYGVIQWGNLSFHTLRMFMSSVEVLVLAIVTFLIFYKMEGVTPRHFGFTWSWGDGGWKKTLSLNFKIFVGLFLLFVVFVNLSHYFFGWWGSNFNVTFSYNAEVGRVRISNAVSRPFLEEIVFRGMYCTLLVRHGIKWRYTILITGIVFGLVHVFNFQPSIFGHVIHVSFTTIVGWFLGWLFYKTRTLVMPILWHYAINAALWFLVLRSDLVKKFASMLIVREFSTFMDFLGHSLYF